MDGSRTPARPRISGLNNANVTDPTYTRNLFQDDYAAQRPRKNPSPTPSSQHHITGAKPATTPTERPNRIRHLGQTPAEDGTKPAVGS